jgi:tyrosyl-tRNA synthetase
MSKSLNNYVGITEPPQEIFGKLMSITDELMWRYYDLLSFRPNEEIAKFKREVAEGRNPRDVKVLLAQEIVARFHSQAAAEEALRDFEARFRQGAIPENLPEITLHTDGKGIAIANACKQAGLVETTSEALRLIQQRGIKIDGETVSDRNLHLAAGSQVVIQAGKRKFARLCVV